MTDKELLELAAKAVGIKKDDSPYNGGGKGNTGFDILGNLVTDWHNGKKWNPLANDGDALRLAVKLGIGISYGVREGRVIAAHFESAYGEWERITPDPYAATRRAIVRAAVEIGKESK